MSERPNFLTIDGATVGDIYSKAMLVETEAEAETYLRTTILHSLSRDTRPRTGAILDEHRKLALGNIGYWAGYYDKETRERVFRLYKTEHPILGTRTDYTSDELLRIGYELAAGHPPPTEPMENDEERN